MGRQQREGQFLVSAGRLHDHELDPVALQERASASMPSAVRSKRLYGPSRPYRHPTSRWRNVLHKSSVSRWPALCVRSYAKRLFGRTLQRQRSCAPPRVWPEGDRTSSAARGSDGHPTLAAGSLAPGAVIQIQGWLAAPAASRVGGLSASVSGAGQRPRRRLPPCDRADRRPAVPHPSLRFARATLPHFAWEGYGRRAPADPQSLCADPSSAQRGRVARRASGETGGGPLRRCELCRTEARRRLRSCDRADRRPAVPHPSLRFARATLPHFVWEGYAPCDASFTHFSRTCPR